MSSTGPLKFIEFFTSTLKDMQKPRITLRGERKPSYTRLTDNTACVGLWKAFLLLPTKAVLLLKRTIETQDNENSRKVLVAH